MKKHLNQATDLALISPQAVILVLFITMLTSFRLMPGMPQSILGRWQQMTVKTSYQKNQGKSTGQSDTETDMSGIGSAVYLFTADQKYTLTSQNHGQTEGHVLTGSWSLFENNLTLNPDEHQKDLNVQRYSEKAARHMTITLQGSILLITTPFQNGQIKGETVLTLIRI